MVAATDVVVDGLEKTSPALLQAGHDAALESAIYLMGLGGTFFKSGSAADNFISYLLQNQLVIHAVHARRAIDNAKLRKQATKIYLTAHGHPLIAPNKNADAKSRNYYEILDIVLHSKKIKFVQSPIKQTGHIYVAHVKPETDKGKIERFSPHALGAAFVYELSAQIRERIQDAVMAAK
jgi:hypothetical protein